MSVRNVKSWWRISVPGRRWVGELLVAAAVVQLHRPVVCVAHVHRSDDRGCCWVLQALMSQQAGWILPVCHRLQNYCFHCCCCCFCCYWHHKKPPVWWNLAEVGESLESSGSLWRGSRARHCCHFSQDCSIIVIKYICHAYNCMSYSLICGVFKSMAKIMLL